MWSDWSRSKGVLCFKRPKTGVSSLRRVVEGVQIMGMQTQHDVAWDGRAEMLNPIKKLSNRVFQRVEVEVVGSLQCSQAVYLKVVSSPVLR